MGKPCGCYREGGTPVPCGEYEPCKVADCYRADLGEHCAWCGHTRGCYELFYAEPAAPDCVRPGGAA